MSDYTREQQVADIKSVFGQNTVIKFNDEDETIGICTEDNRAFYCIIGSDDDEMLFISCDSGYYNEVTVPMTLS